MKQLLNQLMNKYNENSATREDFYEQEKEEKIKKAKEENRRVNNSERSEFQLNTEHDKDKIDNTKVLFQVDYHRKLSDTMHHQESHFCIHQI